MNISIRRIGAFLIDCFILFIISTFINAFINYIIPPAIDIDKLSDNVLNITEQYYNNEITIDEYQDKTNDLNYDLSKATYLSTIAGIVIYILYFVVFQAYNNGQTIGKKILKLQVLKTNGSAPDINSLVKRCLIPYGILVNIILLILLLVLNKSTYITATNIINNIHFMIIFVSIIFMFVKGRGIHDYLAGTKVEKI